MFTQPNRIRVGTDAPSGGFVFILAQWYQTPSGNGPNRHCRDRTGLAAHACLRAADTEPTGPLSAIVRELGRPCGRGSQRGQAVTNGASAPLSASAARLRFERRTDPDFTRRYPSICAIMSSLTRPTSRQATFERRPTAPDYAYLLLR